MNCIAYLYDVEFTQRRSGIYERANELGIRVIPFQNDLLKISPREAIDFAKPDVCIAETDYIHRNHLHPGDIPVPVVICDIDTNLINLGFTGIVHDSSSATGKAMKALTDLKLTNYAFAGYHRPTEWSELRRQIYCKTMRAARLKEHILAFSRRQHLPKYINALEKWLCDLPKPCGVFAVNDEIGDYVIAAANHLGIGIPGTLAVASIDNDIVRCENTRPPLASVPPDFEHSGRMAVDLAIKLLNNPTQYHPPETYGAGEIVTRGSLMRFRHHDSAAVLALDYIRTHITNPRLGLKSVANAMQLPEGTARTRFQRHTGHTIFAEIERQRFLLACTYLRNHRINIEAIHSLCGYGCSRTLRNLFFKRTGMTPSAWRKAHA